MVPFFLLIFVLKSVYNTYEMKQKYPDYVKAFRPKGSVVRLRNKRYLVFRATSKRVPGKSYPVTVIGEQLGWIDSSGFHQQQKILVDFSLFSTYEYGFSNLLLRGEGGFVSKKKAAGINAAAARRIYRSLIVSLSPTSYLSMSEDILSCDSIASEYGLNLCRAKGDMIRSIGLPEEIVRLLFTMVAVYDGRSFRTLPPSAKTKELLEAYHINTEELRNVIAV